MKENDIAKKLGVLKEVMPSTKRTDRMKVKLLQKIDENLTRNTSISYSKNFSPPLYIVFFIFLLLLGSFYTLNTQKSTQPFIYSVKIAMAGNHYEKTKLAFEEAQMQFNSMNNSNGSSYQEVLATTGTTNEYISNLHLQGEKGKYTAEQCKKLYQQYASYLSLLKNRLQSQKQQSYEAQISQYQEQAKSRLAYYKTQV
jgi:hypothetical protein